MREQVYNVVKGHKPPMLFFLTVYVFVSSAYIVINAYISSLYIGLVDISLCYPDAEMVSTLRNGIITLENAGITYQNLIQFYDIGKQISMVAMIALAAVLVWSAIYYYWGE
jgi:hypothetical protein